MKYKYIIFMNGEDNHEDAVAFSDEDEALEFLRDHFSLNPEEETVLVWYKPEASAYEVSGYTELKWKGV